MAARPAWGQVSSPGASAVEAAEPQALVVSHWFDSGDEGEPYTATIRLHGRRVGADGAPVRGQTFVHEESVQGVVPGTGRVSLTSWVYGIAKGEWIVNAELAAPARRSGGQLGAERGRRESAVTSAAWSWRHWRLTDGSSGPVATRWALLAPLARSPGVLPGAFTALAVVGIILAIVTQAVILGGRGLPVASGVVASIVALSGGLIGAKLWYMAIKGQPWRQAIGQGWSVDGFIVLAPLVAVVTSLAMGLPTGAYLDAAAPGIFLAVAIGRVGCFVTGCCAGRCTASRWSVWSSDRRVGARRIPTQLLESGVGLVLAIVTGVAIMNPVPGADGMVFVASMVLYGVARQGLLRLRAETRRFSWRRAG